MSDALYREIILEHWKNPQNYGEMDKADIVANEANPLCGDEIKIMAKLKNGRIIEISFVGQGCAISTASASLMTQMVKRMKISDFKKTKAETFMEKFNLNFSPARLKCTLLGFSTLKKALKLSS
jgi:nitrogen fixation NifU-like protein